MRKNKKPKIHKHGGSLIIPLTTQLKKIGAKKGERLEVSVNEQEQQIILGKKSADTLFNLVESDVKEEFIEIVAKEYGIGYILDKKKLARVLTLVISEWNNKMKSIWTKPLIKKKI